MSASPFLKKLAVFATASLVVFLTLEILARLFFADFAKEPVVPPTINLLDEKLGWRLKPNLSVASNRLGYEIEYHMNSKGLRDDETPYQKPDGVFRVVLLGDSRTFGFGVPIEKHFSRILEGYFEDFEVVNLGISGYGVDQQLLYLREEGFKYQPDLVMAYVAHYASHRHMYAERFGMKKPHFELADRELQLKNVPVPIQSSGAFSFVREMHHWGAANSVVYHILGNGLLRMMKKNNAKTQATQEKSGAADAEFTRRLHELGATIVFQMQKDAETRGANFVLVTEIPELHWTMQKEGVLSLDVSQALDNHFYPLPEDLKHINESGNGVLAWEIAQFLKEERLTRGE